MWLSAFFATAASWQLLLVEQFFDFAYDIVDHFVVLKRAEVVADFANSAIEQEALLKLVSV